MRLAFPRSPFPLDPIARAGREWCEGWDSNPQALRRRNLNPVRLPIPPPSPPSFLAKSGIKTTYYTFAVFSLFAPMSVGHYENFPVASLLLPAPARRAVALVYRFARSADDIADEGSDAPAVRLEKLNGYRDELRSIAGRRAPAQPLFRELAEVVRDHGLPLDLFE